MTITITKDNFKTEVLDSKVPVLLDFWAAWCGPCKMVGPVVEELSGEVTGLAKVGKVNVDEQGELAQQFMIMSIPTLMVFKDGKPAGKVVGVRDKRALKDLLGV